MSRCNYTSNSQADFRIVSVLNYGAFVAQTELLYSYQGERYRFHNPELLVLEEFKINVPLNATDIKLSVFIEDLFKGTYLLFEKLYDIANDSCFLLWGLSFSAQYKKINCSGPGEIKNFLPPAIIISPENLNTNCYSSYIRSYLANKTCKSSRR